MRRMYRLASTPDELEETRPRVERDITLGHIGGQHQHADQQKPEPDVQEHQPRKDERSQDDILKSFTEAAGQAESVEKLELIFNGVWPDDKNRARKMR
jgi:hypothetical protein